MAYEIWELTPEQKEKVNALYETTKLGDMVPLVYGPDKKADGRTTEGRSIQAYLAGVGKTVTTTVPPPNDGPTELTPDQRLAVEKLSPRCRTTLELAQAVFNDKTIKQQSRPYKLVWEYRREVYPEGINMEDEPVDDKMYKPPTTIQSLIGLVNKWVPVGKTSKRAYTFGMLKASEERCLDKLMGYIRTFSFTYTASQYERQVDRDLFISQFIRWAHDKPDLTEIEVDQMVLAANERVNIAQIDREIQRITKMQDDIVNGTETDENGKTKKFGMVEVEMINGVRTKHDAAKKRLSDLMKDLETVRSKRLDAQRDRYGSIIDILDAFMKDEDMRNRIFLDEGIAEKDEDKAEVERLSGVDELMALISGQSKEEGGA
jgi:hypothetical protein